MRGVLYDSTLQEHSQSNLTDSPCRGDYICMGGGDRTAVDRGEVMKPTILSQWLNKYSRVFLLIRAYILILLMIITICYSVQGILDKEDDRGFIYADYR